MASVVIYERMQNISTGKLRKKLNESLQFSPQTAIPSGGCVFVHN